MCSTTYALEFYKKHMCEHPDYQLPDSVALAEPFEKTTEDDRVDAVRYILLG